LNVKIKATEEQGGKNLMALKIYENKAKVGKVLSSRRVKGSEKLIKLIVDIGEERQIVAGIGKLYDPEELCWQVHSCFKQSKTSKTHGSRVSGNASCSNRYRWNNLHPYS